MSVVIPTTGRASLLDAVRSVLAQTVSATAIVVVADGDDSLQSATTIAASLHSPAVTVIGAPRHGHPGPVRNIGVALVDSPFVAFLDDDDRWEPDKLEAQMPTFAPGVVAVASNAVSIGGDGERPYFAGAVGGTKRFREFVHHNPLIASSVVCRTAALKHVGGFPSARELAGVEDYVAWIKLATQGTVVVVDRPLVHYAVGSPGSVSSRTGIADQVSAALDAAADDLRSVEGVRGARCVLRTSAAGRRLRSRVRTVLRTGRHR